MCVFQEYLLLPVLTEDMDLMGWEAIERIERWWFTVHWSQVCTTPSLKLWLDIDLHTVMIAFDAIDGQESTCTTPFPKKLEWWKTKGQKDKLSDVKKKEILFFLEKLGDMFGLLAGHFST